MIEEYIEPLTPSFMRRATRDWEAVFPDLKFLKVQWIGRIIGPLFQGILLDRDSTNAQYRPTWHVHNLAERSNHIGLEMMERFCLDDKPGIEDPITPPRHRNDFDRIIGRFREQMTLPMEGDIQIAELIQAYETHIEEEDYGRVSWYHLVTLMTLAIWGGDAAQIKARRKWCLEQWESFPDKTKAIQKETGRADQIFWVLDASRADIESSVEDSIVRLKLQKLKRFRLLPYQ